MAMTARRPTAVTAATAGLLEAKVGGVMVAWRVMEELAEAKEAAARARVEVARVRVVEARVGEVKDMVELARVMEGAVKVRAGEAKAKAESESLHPVLRAAHQRRSQSDCRALGRLCRRGTSCNRPQW